MSVASTGLSKHETHPLARMTYSIDEVSALLGIGRTVTYDLARQNKLPVPVIRLGRRMLVSKAALDRVLGAGAGEAA